MDVLHSLQKMIAYLAAPPVGIFILLFIALLIWRSKPKLAFIGVCCATLALLLASMPLVIDPLYNLFAAQQNLTSAQLRELHSNTETTAIVVIGQGRLAAVPEYDAVDQVDGQTLLLLSYSKYVQQKTNFPILVASLDNDEAAIPGSVLMNQTLSTRFALSPQWMLSDQHPQQLVQSIALQLGQHQISHILLISARDYSLYWQRQFASTGLNVIAAPAIVHQQGNHSSFWQKILPNMDTLALSNRLLHWWLGDRLY
jgi:hypothetical protein